MKNDKTRKEVKALLHQQIETLNAILAALNAHTENMRRILDNRPPACYNAGAIEPTGELQ